MKKKVLFDTLRENRGLLLLFAAAGTVSLSVFYLYRILTEPLWYAELLIAVFCLLLLCIDFFRRLKKEKQLCSARLSAESGNVLLPEAENLTEQEYQGIVRALAEKINELSLAADEEKQDMQDWYVAWVHQIKTPLAVMKLQVPEEEKALSAELFRIEEYVDMALSYIRLGSEQNDLVIQAYPLDELIRETLRKYAFQFITRKIALSYTPTERTVVTDKKWFSCILEQYVSNALKYSDGGTVTVSVSGNTLTVADTGVGIAREDLPRIFEKGYTGVNGRSGAKSSGLGLYLSAKAAKLIGVTLSAESTPGCGSRFSVTFPEQP